MRNVLLQPLDDRARRMIRGLSTTLCVLSALLAPIAGLSSMQPMIGHSVSGEELTLSTLPEPDTMRPLRIRRDPFVADPGADSRTAPSAQPAQNGDNLIGMRVVQGDPTGITLPPNAGVWARISAIVSGGGSSRALVEENGQTRVVGVGDMLEGSKVVAIDASGLRLENGVRLVLNPEHP